MYFSACCCIWILVFADAFCAFYNSVGFGEKRAEQAHVRSVEPVL